ncbi:unnamed protein product [Vitrella brassicaformis CCMP3155]|uniref:Uncharacterized protein n=4 Tax=Vitrella brassicaformis TaxID=1169539 RepID=A0A0G4FUP1_VITBC|nr:unnamed protein product [Vitrella brassicaformis CCMP3155]|eukprot:CEM18313.1 unnamed protein product [Vitrella brassicaformis CCMP3155]
MGKNKAHAAKGAKKPHTDRAAAAAAAAPSASASSRPVDGVCVSEPPYATLQWPREQLSIGRGEAGALEGRSIGVRNLRAVFTPTLIDRGHDGPEGGGGGGVCGVGMQVHLQPLQDDGQYWCSVNVLVRITLVNHKDDNRSVTQGRVLTTGQGCPPYTFWPFIGLDRLQTPDEGFATTQGVVTFRVCVVPRFQCDIIAQLDKPQPSQGVDLVAGDGCHSSILPRSIVPKHRPTPPLLQPLLCIPSVRSMCLDRCNALRAHQDGYTDHPNLLSSLVSLCEHFAAIDRLPEPSPPPQPAQRGEPAEMAWRWPPADGRDGAGGITASQAHMLQMDMALQNVFESFVHKCCDGDLAKMTDPAAYVDRFTPFLQHALTPTPPSPSQQRQQQEHRHPQTPADTHTNGCTPPVTDRDQDDAAAGAIEMPPEGSMAVDGEGNLPPTSSPLECRVIHRVSCRGMRCSYAFATTSTAIDLDVTKQYSSVPQLLREYCRPQEIERYNLSLLRLGVQRVVRQRSFDPNAQIICMRFTYTNGTATPPPPPAAPAPAPVSASASAQPGPNPPILLVPDGMDLSAIEPPPPPTPPHRRRKHADQHQPHELPAAAAAAAAPAADVGADGTDGHTEGRVYDLHSLLVAAEGFGGGRVLMSVVHHRFRRGNWRVFYDGTVSERGMCEQPLFHSIPDVDHSSWVSCRPGFTILQAIYIKAGVFAGEEGGGVVCPSYVESPLDLTASPPYVGREAPLQAIKTREVKVVSCDALRRLRGGWWRLTCDAMQHVPLPTEAVTTITADRSSTLRQISAKYIKRDKAQQQDSVRRPPDVSEWYLFPSGGNSAALMLLNMNDKPVEMAAVMRLLGNGCDGVWLLAVSHCDSLTTAQAVERDLVNGTLSDEKPFTLIVKYFDPAKLVMFCLGTVALGADMPLGHIARWVVETLREARDDANAIPLPAFQWPTDAKTLMCQLEHVWTPYLSIAMRHPVGRILSNKTPVPDGYQACRLCGRYEAGSTINTHEGHCSLECFHLACLDKMRPQLTKLIDTGACERSDVKHANFPGSLPCWVTVSDQPPPCSEVNGDYMLQPQLLDQHPAWKKPPQRSLSPPHPPGAGNMGLSALLRKNPLMLRYDGAMGYWEVVSTAPDGKTYCIARATSGSRVVGMDPCTMGLQWSVWDGDNAAFRDSPTMTLTPKGEGRFGCHEALIVCGREGSNAALNGDYELMPQRWNGRPAYRKATNTHGQMAFLYFRSEVGCWQISPVLGSAQNTVASCGGCGTVWCPSECVAVWEVWDPDRQTRTLDRGILITPRTADCSRDGAGGSAPAVVTVWRRKGEGVDTADTTDMTGDYFLTDRTHNGRPCYKKHGPTIPPPPAAPEAAGVEGCADGEGVGVDRWLYYDASRGFWQIAPELGDKEILAEGGREWSALHPCAETLRWWVWDGSKEAFVQDHQIALTEASGFPAALEVSGRVGFNSHINAAYTLMPDLFDGRPAYKSAPSHNRPEHPPHPSPATPSPPRVTPDSPPMPKGQKRHRAASMGDGKAAVRAVKGSSGSSGRVKGTSTSSTSGPSVYLFFRAATGRWELSAELGSPLTLAESTVQWSAFSPHTISGVWCVYDGDAFRPDANIVIKPLPKQDGDGGSPPLCYLRVTHGAPRLAPGTTATSGPPLPTSPASHMHHQPSPHASPSPLYKTEDPHRAAGESAHAADGQEAREGEPPMLAAAADGDGDDEIIDLPPAADALAEEANHREAATHDLDASDSASPHDHDEHDHEQEDNVPSPSGEQQPQAHDDDNEDEDDDAHDDDAAGAAHPAKSQLRNAKRKEKKLRRQQEREAALARQKVQQAAEKAEQRRQRKMERQQREKEREEQERKEKEAAEQREREREEREAAAMVHKSVLSAAVNAKKTTAKADKDKGKDKRGTKADAEANQAPPPHPPPQQQEQETKATGPAPSSKAAAAGRVSPKGQEQPDNKNTRAQKQRVGHSNSASSVHQRWLPKGSPHQEAMSAVSSGAATPTQAAPATDKSKRDNATTMTIERAEREVYYGAVQHLSSHHSVPLSELAMILQSSARPAMDHLVLHVGPESLVQLLRRSPVFIVSDGMIQTNVEMVGWDTLKGRIIAEAHMALERNTFLDARSLLDILSQAIPGVEQLLHHRSQAATAANMLHPLHRPARNRKRGSSHAHSHHTHVTETFIAHLLGRSAAPGVHVAMRLDSEGREVMPVMSLRPLRGAGRQYLPFEVSDEVRFDGRPDPSSCEPGRGKKKRHSDGDTPHNDIAHEANGSGVANGHNGLPVILPRHNNEPSLTPPAEPSTTLAAPPLNRFFMPTPRPPQPPPPRSAILPAAASERATDGLQGRHVYHVPVSGMHMVHVAALGGVTSEIDMGRAMYVEQLEQQMIESSRAAHSATPDASPQAAPAQQQQQQQPQAPPFLQQQVELRLPISAAHHREEGLLPSPSGGVRGAMEERRDQHP